MTTMTSIEQTSFSKLHKNTARRVLMDTKVAPKESSRVYLMRRGDRLVGTAVVNHRGSFRRRLEASVNATTPVLEAELGHFIRQDLEPLHRAIEFVG